MSPPIDVTVAAVIEQNGRFLVVEELVGGQRVFNQPAGHLECGESLSDAAVREVFEETGFRFLPRALLGVFLWQGTERSFLRVAFIGDAEAPRGPAELDEGIIATHWMTRADLDGRSANLRSPMVMRCIDRYLAGQSHPLDALCDLLPDIESIANIA